MTRTRGTLSMLAGAALCALAAPAHAGAGLGAREKAAIDRGEVLTFFDQLPSTDMIKAKAIGLLDAAPAQAFEVFGDYAAWRTFMPRLLESRILARQGPWHTWVLTKTSLPWPVSNAWVSAKYTRYVEPDGRFRIAWWRTAGNMRQYTGQAVLYPWWRGPSKAVMQYELVAEPDTMAPDRSINKGAIKVVRSVVNAFRKRLRSLAAAGRLPSGAPQRAAR